MCSERDLLAIGNPRTPCSLPVAQSFSHPVDLKGFAPKELIAVFLPLLLGFYFADVFVIEEKPGHKISGAG